MHCTAVRQQCQLRLAELNIEINKSWRPISIADALLFHQLVDSLIFKVDSFCNEMTSFYQLTISGKFDKRKLLEVAIKATGLKKEIDEMSKKQFAELKQSHRALATLLRYRQSMTFNIQGSFE